jgi:sec-independent protein translocase protein TatC
MVLTPPDPASQIIMAVPMCILYEGCIWAIWLREKVIRKKRDAENGM